jgi:lipid-binding SYLF domain-containing protein
MDKFIVAATVVLATASGASAAITSSEIARLNSAARVVQDLRGDVSQEYWAGARCVVVIPELKKAAFIFGGEYGKGVMSCREGDRWNAPVFVQLAKGSWGFQAGAEQVDVVLLVLNEQGVQKLLQNKVNLGADVSIVAGPIGRQGQVGTDAALTAEILSYSRAQGLFAGIDLSGGVLRPDEEANGDVYGPGASPRTILASREMSAPTQASAFLKALRAMPTATPAARGTISTASGDRADAAPATPRTTTVATVDEDLRTRVIDIQQTLDRMLAETTPAAVGTTGTTGGTPPNAVTVDRGRLLLLRQQLDSLIATLNRR